MVAKKSEKHADYIPTIINTPENRQFFKAVKDFSAEYLDGKKVATPEAFIVAKEAEYCVKHGVADVTLGSVTNAFNGILDEGLLYTPKEDGMYTVMDLIHAWKDAESSLRYGEHVTF